MNKTIWMFAGQGSQHFHMGRELFEGEPVFRRTMLTADAIFHDLVNESLTDILYQPRPDRFAPFKRLLHSSPAILAVECSLAYLLLDRGHQPDLLLGQSLGEISSMVIAGVLSFEDALTLVIKKSALLEYCAPPGGMLSVMESPDIVHRFPSQFAECEIAGWNFPRSFIVSGTREPLIRLRTFLREQDIKVFDLPVAHAFHSRWTDQVSSSVRTLLDRLEFHSPRIPVESCGQIQGQGQTRDETQTHDQDQDQTQAHDLDPVRHSQSDESSRAKLWNALRSRIDVPQAITRLEASGPHLYVDLGPAGNMATAVKYNLPNGSKSRHVSIITPFGHDNRNLQRFLHDPHSA